MPLVAITREVSSSINRCELSFRERQPIDLKTALAQHAAYQHCLESLGAQVISLPAEPDLPDSVFVEDAAIVFDQVAVIPIMGATSRRDEPRSLIPVLSRYRPIEYLSAPATLDGGDVLVADSRVFVGLTKRTNQAGVNQLRDILQPHGHTVEAVAISNLLHLKSACSYLGNNTLLIDRRFIDQRMFQRFDLIDVPEQEPAAANVLLVNGTMIVAASFPETAALLERRHFKVREIDVSEVQKAEAGVTCCSLILTQPPTGNR